MFYSNVNYVSFSSVLPLFDIDPEPFTAQWHKVTAISYLYTFNLPQGKDIPGLNIINFYFRFPVKMGTRILLDLNCC